MTRRKNQIRKHIKLSNGQVMTITFFRRDAVTKCNNINRIWNVSLIIGKNEKHNRLWDNNKLIKEGIKSTGKCGLEGLIKALHIIIEFRNNMKIHEEIHIDWADEKRKRAYKYLEKYDFFYSSEDMPCYWSLNPKYYELEGVKGDD